MARLIIGQNVVTLRQATIDELAVEADMIKIAMKYKDSALAGYATVCRPAKIVNHHLMLLGVHVALMVSNTGVFYPQIQSIEAAISHHVIVQALIFFRLERKHLSEQ